MSAKYGKLCSVLLLEHFGEIVEKVACDLMKWGTKPLRLIVATTRLPLSKVKQALRILIQYGFVTFSSSQVPTVAEYTVKPEKIILLLRYPRYLLLIKTRFGDEAEMIVEETLRVGQDTASSIIIKAATRLKDTLKEEDSSQFVGKDGESGGGQYVLNIKEAFTQLTWTTIENTVLERFGSKAARIFRLVRAKEFVEQEQIQQLVMIPAKEAKLYTYRLLQENFIQMQELRKTMSTNQPNKTFFLFHIDLNQVARMLLEVCYHATYNAMIRREHEKNENRRLIEKQQRIASITQNLREQGATPEQLAEIEEMLTPPERSLVEKVRMMLNKLSMAELQLDETIFILQIFLNY